MIQARLSWLEPRPRGIIKGIFLIVSWIVFVAPGDVTAQYLDDVMAEVTMQRADKEGNTRPGYHIGRLNCHRGECNFVWVTLGQCFGSESFFPKIETFSTLNKTLSVSRFRDVLEVRPYIDSSRKIELNMKLQSGPDHLHGLLQDFNGIFIDHNISTARSDTSFYIPVFNDYYPGVNKSRTMTTRNLDCRKVDLLGVPR